MANEVIIEFKADTSQLEPAILFYQKIGKLSEQDAEKITRLSQATGKNLSDAAEKAAGSFQKLNKEAKDAGQTIATKLVLDKSKDVTKTIDAVTSLRTQIKQAVQETASLTEKFGA